MQRAALVTSTFRYAIKQLISVEMIFAGLNQLGVGQRFNSYIVSEKTANSWTWII